VSGKHILIVEDDESITLGLDMNLRAEGYRVSIAIDGESALAMAAEGDIDLAIIDVMLPRMNGFEVVRALRARGQTVPIIMLSARGAEMDKVMGLELGAEDYVTKPFGLAELRSRIRAVLRRTHGRVVDGVRAVGPVTIDQRERQVTVGGAPVRLTFSEYELLACLMERPGKLFTRQELLRAIWGDSAYRDPRAIDVHIRHLREKLEERPEEPSLILTVRGAGYRFREQ
jgi:DNA-binding response OmpR family regulator